MQIMNLQKIAKDFWWNLTAFKTLNDLPDSVIIVNPDGEVKQYNHKAAKVLGLNYDESSVLNFNEIIKDGMSIVKKSVEDNKPIFATVSASGNEFYVEISAVHKLNSYLVSIRDVTTLTKELDNEDKTRRFNNEKNAMLALLEDDIKSPITSISGFSRGLLDGLGGELTEKQAKYVKIINSNAEELFNFMDKFLQFSKAESSIYESDFHTFDITDAFKSIVSDYNDLIKEKKLEFDMDDSTLEKRNAYTDVPSVKDAFRNLLEVAIQMTEKGYVSVKLTHPDEETCIKYGIEPEKNVNYAQIIINNSSKGLSDDEMKYLCEPYAQLHEKGKKNLLRALQLGTASIMVKRAQGFIDIYSDTNGMKYTVILPIEKR